MEIRGRGVGAGGHLPGCPASQAERPKSSPCTYTTTTSTRNTTTADAVASSRAKCTSSKPSVKRLATSSSTLAPTLVEAKLVGNLKKQIACLEAQVTVLKQRLRTDEASRQFTQVKPSAPQNDGHAVSLPPSEEEKMKDDFIVPTVPLPSSSRGGSLAAIPEPFLSEIAALQFNLESLIVDSDATQELCLHLQREKEVMGEEYAQLRGDLCAAAAEQRALEAERAAALAALDAEQVKRREAESRREVAPTSAPHLQDMIRQRDFFKIQAEKSKTREAILGTRVQSLEESLAQERVLMVSTETQLCAALDRCQDLERRQERASDYYANLGTRFVTMSAVVRKLLEVHHGEGRRSDDRTAREGSSDDAAAATRAVAAPSLYAAEVSAEVTEALEQVDQWQKDILKRPLVCGTKSPQQQQQQQQKVESERGEKNEITEGEKVAIAETAFQPCQGAQTSAALPVPPAASVPAPPAASVPVPPAASVPAPPAASVPAPQSGVPPPPPASSVPIALCVVEGEGVTSGSVFSPGPPIPPTLEEQLARVEGQVTAEAALLAEYVKAHTASVPAS